MQLSLEYFECIGERMVHLQSGRVGEVVREALHPVTTATIEVTIRLEDGLEVTGCRNDFEHERIPGCPDFSELSALMISAVDSRG
jgi:hypothetical protein